MKKTGMRNGTPRVQVSEEDRFRAAQADDAKRRVEVCWKEIGECLRKYRCILGAVPYIDQAGRIFARPAIKAEP